MNVEFTRKFERQINLVKDASLKNEIAEVVKSVMRAGKLSEIANLKKLKGYKTAFRIRTGHYRIGVILHDNTIFFSAFAHRKDIYKKFP